MECNTLAVPISESHLAAEVVVSSAEDNTITAATLSSSVPCVSTSFEEQPKPQMVVHQGDQLNLPMETDESELVEQDVPPPDFTPEVSTSGMSGVEDKKNRSPPTVSAAEQLEIMGDIFARLSGYEVGERLQSTDFAESVSPVSCSQYKKNSSLLDGERTSLPCGDTANIEELHLEVNDSVLQPKENDSKTCESSDPQQGENEFQNNIDVSKESAPSKQTAENTYPKYEFEGDIQMITGSWTDFQKSSDECFTKGCKWAPDGTCILTNSDDNVLRVFDLPRDLHCQESWTIGRTLPEITPALKIRAGGQVYDYCWYPLMSSDDPLSCCLVSSSQHAPINMWDAYTGAIRCTYRPFNDMDEVEHAYSVTFGASGEKLYCGFKNKVRVFDTCNPGRVCTTRSLKGCGRVICIISAICVNPVVEKLYVVGSYSRTIAVCSEPDGKVLCLFCGQGGGVTHLAFSPDGSKLYAGCRKDSQILCWDLRNLGTVLYALERDVNNHQRIYFDISADGHYLMSGGTNGKVTVWDLHRPPVLSSTGGHPILPALNRFLANNDSVNGISLHQQYPILATSSGQRHYGEVDEESDDDFSPLLKKRHIQQENGLKLWWLGRTSES